MLTPRCRGFIISCLLCLTVPIVSEANQHGGRVALTFEKNEGQTDGSVRFLARGANGTILLTNDGPILTDPRKPSDAAVHFHFRNAKKTIPIPESPTGGFANYFTSQDRKQWLSHIPMFSRIRYAGIYKGIDVVFHGNEDQMEFDFEVSPAGDPHHIVFTVNGAQRTSIAADGNLKIVSADETWQLLSPVAYQQLGTMRRPVQVNYRLLKNGSVALKVGQYDASLPLVIDPVVTSASFLPAVISNVVATRLDGQNNLIITGTSGNEIGLIKLIPAGTSIIYKTQIGTANLLGGDSSGVNALALDVDGNAYIAGWTRASDFPVTSNLGTCNQSCQGGGIAAKFGPDGSLIYSTIVAASVNAQGMGIAIDAYGNAYLAGNAGYQSFQTVNAFQSQPMCVSCSSAFYAKLNPSGTGFVFASYFYGSSLPAQWGNRANKYCLRWFR